MYKLKKIRLLMKLSVKEMALFLGISRTCLYGYERGYRVPQDRLAFQILDRMKGAKHKITFEELKTRGSRSDI